MSQGKSEFDPKIITSVAGSPCFKHVEASFRVGDKAGNLGLVANLGALASRKAEINIEIRGNVQYYLCTPEESAQFEKLDPTRFKYQDKTAHFKNLPLRDLSKMEGNASYGWLKSWEKQNRKLENLKNNEEKIRGMPLWIKVGKDQAAWFRSGNTYTGLKPTEFVPMYNSVDEMPIHLQKTGPSYWNGKRVTGWKEILPYGTSPPIWKSVKYKWATRTPERRYSPIAKTASVASTKKADLATARPAQ